MVQLKHAQFVVLKLYSNKAVNRKRRTKTKQNILNKNKNKTQQKKHHLSLPQWYLAKESSKKFTLANRKVILHGRILYGSIYLIL